MTLQSDNSSITGTLAGNIGVAYETTAPYGPTSNTGRAFDPNSHTYYNGGSYEGTVSMEYDGGYQIAQNSPLGEDGLLLQVNLYANSSAFVPPDGVSYWNITSGLSAFAQTETHVDLAFRSNQPNGYYLFSFLQNASFASISINGTGVAAGVEEITVQADPNGFLHFTGDLISDAYSESGTVVNDLSDSFKFQLEPTVVPEPRSAALILCGILILAGCRMKRGFPQLR